jgi:hypothetical protein
MSDNNPYNLCTWDEQSDCSECGNHGRLHCKWERKVLMGFLLLALPYMIIAFFGMVVTGILTGVWWMLIAYVVFFFVFFGILEIRILCSHCPYYAENSKILHCFANHGTPKLWHYHPEPLNRFEKISSIAGFFIFGGFPLLSQGHGILFLAVHYKEYALVALLGLIGIAVATLLTAISFFSVLSIYYCPNCVNFSCPLNRVPQSMVDEYLERNPVMKEAWEKSGYKLKE